MFGVDRANIEQDTAIYKLENLYLEMYGLLDTLSGRLLFLSKFWSFWMAVSRTNIGLINTKLENAADFNVLFSDYMGLVLFIP